MKTQNKKKIIVSTLALAMGAALAGSISGSVAWYQYSTRAAAQITGTSAGTIGELQIRGRKIADPEVSWSNGGTDNKVNLGNEQYKPMSIIKDGTNIDYVHAPLYMHAEPEEYGSDPAPYIEYELQFMFEHRKGADAGKKAKEVYLTYFDIEKASGATYDFSKAVRVELRDSSDALIALLSDESAETINTKGKLDLNQNGKLDTTYWDCTDKEVAAVAAVAGAALGADEEPAAGVDYYTREANTDGAGYLNDGSNAYTKVDSIPAAPRAENTYFPLTNLGSDAIEQIEYVNKVSDGEQYVTDDHADLVVDTTDSAFDPYHVENSGVDELVTTSADGEGWSDSLKVRIWLEGWALLNNSAMWSEESIGQQFNVNMQFACSAEIQ